MVSHGIRIELFVHDNLEVGQFLRFVKASAAFFEFCRLKELSNAK